MPLRLRGVVAALVVTGSLLPTTASAQINFTKTAYYLSLGDSLAGHAVMAHEFEKAWRALQ